MTNLHAATQQPDGSLLYPVGHPEGRVLRDGVWSDEVPGEGGEPATTADTPVSDLAFLSNAVKKVLVEAGIDTVATLLATSDEELIALNGVAEKTVEKIREHLADLHA